MEKGSTSDTFQEKVRETIASSSTDRGFTTPTSRLRVLVVDDNLVCLTMVAAMLKSCEYEVVTANQGEAGLDILRNGEIRVDAVLTDLHMPGVTGFDIVEEVKKDIKIPVILMSADSRENTFRKGLEYGACYYMVKPIKINHVKNIWRHVYTRKRELGQAYLKLLPEISPRVETRKSCDWGSSINACKEAKKNRVIDEDDEVMVPPKKQRLSWSPELHNQFLAALDEIGLDDAVPKSILYQMKGQTPYLTREHVASHLQKYRIFMRRMTDKASSMVKWKCSNSLYELTYAQTHPSLSEMHKGLAQSAEEGMRKKERKWLHGNGKASQDEINTPIENSPGVNFPDHTEVASCSNSPIAHLMYQQQQLQQQQQQQQQLQHLQLQQQLQQQQEPWIQNSSSVDQQTVSSSYQLLRNNLSGLENGSTVLPRSGLLTNNSGGLVNGNTVLPRSELLNNNPRKSDFTGFKFQAQNNIGGTKSMEPFSTLSQAQDFITNNNDAGNKNLNYNNLFNQPAPVAESSSSILAAEPSNLFSNLSYAAQGAVSFNMLVGKRNTTHEHIVGMRSMEPFNTLNQAQDFNITNSDNTGSKNVNYTNLFNQPAPVAGCSSSIQAAGPSNLFGNMSYATQGAVSPNMIVGKSDTTERAGTSHMFAGAYPVQDLLSNATEHQQPAQVVNHAIDQIAEGDFIDQLLRDITRDDQMDSFSQLFSAVDIGDLRFDQAKQGGDGMMDSNFDFNNMDIN